MKYLILSLFVFLQVSAHACDLAIQSFPRDCAIQDRYNALKSAYQVQQINIDEIAEYRVIRFVDRYNWERAKTSRIKPEQIYQPAPATWQVWDSGMRAIMASAGSKHILFNGYALNNFSMSFINKNLLKNEQLNLNVKGDITDPTLQPGEFRIASSTGVGFRSDGKDYASMIASAEASMDRLQTRWETSLGVSFSVLVTTLGTPATSESSGTTANLRSGMKQNEGNTFITYAPSTEVPVAIDWITQFIRINLDRYRMGSPVLSPMELATVVQKWFVSIHPFSDGNGRTSRALQDVILANFGMPFVPGGDLQEDATADYESYIEATYQKTEKMLSTLELCQTRNAEAFQCLTVDHIHSLPDEVRQQQFKKAVRKKD